MELRSPDNKVVSSKWKKQLYDNPQGSVLGPLLWNLFFDPLLDELSSIPSTLDTLELAFADDLTLVATSTHPRPAELLLEYKLAHFSAYLTTRGMKLLISKLKTMCIRKTDAEHTYEPHIVVDGNLVEPTTKHKFLGIFYDQKFSFASHLKLVQEKVVSRTRAMTILRGAKWGPTQATMLVLY